MVSFRLKAHYCICMSLWECKGPAQFPAMSQGMRKYSSERSWQASSHNIFIVSFCLAIVRSTFLSISQVCYLLQLFNDIDFFVIVGHIIFSLKGLYLHVKQTGWVILVAFITFLFLHLRLLDCFSQESQYWNMNHERKYLGHLC